MARECGGGLPGQVEPGAALVTSLAWHHPTDCSQELPPPQLEASVSTQKAFDPCESRFKKLSLCLPSFKCPLLDPVRHMLNTLPSLLRTLTVSPLTPLCSSTSQAHPANLAVHL